MKKLVLVVSACALQVAANSALFGAPPAKTNCAADEGCNQPVQKGPRKVKPVQPVKRESIFLDTGAKTANPASGEYSHFGFYGQEGNFGPNGFQNRYDLGGYNHSDSLLQMH